MSKTLRNHLKIILKDYLNIQNFRLGWLSLKKEYYYDTGMKKKLQ